MPRPLRSRRAALAALAAATCLVAPTAFASSASAAGSMAVSIADDGVLNGQHGDPEPFVEQWQRAGVEDVRVFAQWSHIAPDTNSVRPPEGFDDTTENAYDFRALDRKIDLVRRHGMSVTLTITGPGPVWGSKEPARRNPRWKPDPERFGRFATAVTKHVADRVDRYVVWNEPNVATWLQPQYRCTSAGHCTSYAPHLYRELATEGYRAIRRQDPSATIAIGATSSKGDAEAIRVNATTQPLTFLREMACVSSRYTRRKGGSCRGFKAARGNVLAYHPHSSKLTPGQRSPSRGDARMGDLSRLTTVLDKLTRARRISAVGVKSRKLPLWLDEYAYETNPPDERLGISLAKQAAWSQWGWWTAARNPRVKLLTHYEWRDEAIADEDAEAAPGWQSGLYFVDGRAKPLAQAFANPIFGWRTSRTAAVWGQVRPGSGKVRVQLQRRSGGRWRAYRTVTTNTHGGFEVRVPRSSSARYRYTYTAPDGSTAASRSTTLRKR
ncbi:hypothetical protein ACVU7I_10120 [Patulibacter sp. S7RM1-6]